MKKIVIVVGTRPNFIKVTQFQKHAERFGFEITVIHTGQHHNHRMAKVFFSQFDLEPDIVLDLAQSTPLSKIGEMLTMLEAEFLKEKPDVVLVCGDVDSTLAAAIAANRLGIFLGHIESGLRSFDRAMPEEINRIMVDSISNVFYVTEKSGLHNLKVESKPEKDIVFVGNTMIDTLMAFSDRIDQNGICEELKIQDKEFVVVTMHRPSNVDNRESLEKVISLVNRIAKKYYVVVPIHPRTGSRLEELDLSFGIENDKIITAQPLDYFSFQRLIREAKAIVTDSGGIQEETTFLQIPCITVRPNTERPITIEIGTNTLIGLDVDGIIEVLDQINQGVYKKGVIPEYWDGSATERILADLRDRIV